jgi:hypothetical protein
MFSAFSGYDGIAAEQSGVVKGREWKTDGEAEVGVLLHGNGQ